MKHKLTPRQWVPWFVFLAVGFLYEIYTVFWGVQNDTLSHVVVWTIEQAPWVAYALPAMVGVVLLHWLVRNPIWNKPKFQDDDELPAPPADDESEAER